MAAPLDPFIPLPDIRERFQTIVKAAVPVVLETACGFDLQSLTLVRTLIWLRGKLMGATAAPARVRRGLLEETRSLGWETLVEQPGLIVCGAACQPWKANAIFTPIAAERFVAYAEPNQVKIVWTLEAEALRPGATLLSHETRVVATDAQARRTFRRYWRWARCGIIGIRLLLLPAVRRHAERQLT